jgi:hypothetical protein
VDVPRLRRYWQWLGECVALALEPNARKGQVMSDPVPRCDCQSWPWLAIYVGEDLVACMAIEPTEGSATPQQQAELHFAVSAIVGATEWSTTCPVCGWEVERGPVAIAPVLAAAADQMRAATHDYAQRIVRR